MHSYVLHAPSNIEQQMYLDYLWYTYAMAYESFYTGTTYYPNKLLNLFESIV